MGLSDRKRSRFDAIHACDRQTDGIGVAYTRYVVGDPHNKKAVLSQR